MALHPPEQPAQPAHAHPQRPHQHHTHQHDLTRFRHAHAFHEAGGEASRGRALIAVTVLTLVTMVVELLAGWWTGSLALMADGWHMGTHAAALGGAVLAQHWARQAREHERFAFGGWKIEVLAGYTSALLLAAVTGSLVVEAVQALWTPRDIAFADAAVVAVLGLVVNLASVWLLHRAGHAHDHGHGHGHEHGHGHGHRHAPGPDHDQAHDHPHGHGPGHGPGHDHGHHHGGHGHHHGHAHRHDQGHAQHAAHAAPTAAAAPTAPAAAQAAPVRDANFQAAYMHVLADALTSVLAIGALLGGLWLGWRWLDPAVALVGAVVIGQWAWGLLRHSAVALVDATGEDTLRQAVRQAIESDGDAQLADLHVWQVGPQAHSVVLSVVADQPLPAQAYRARLQGLARVRHVTVEVHRCPEAPDVAGALHRPDPATV